MAGLTESVLTELAAVVGERHVLVDPDTTVGFATDWSGRYLGQTPAVIRPGSTEEVSAALAVLSRAEVPVVPQGGNTGLVGASVPLDGELVLSLRRLDEIGPVDQLSSQVTCGAGVTLAELQKAASAADLAFGVDLAARDSCTIGGMVATNAGGIHVIRYGSMRAQIVGLEVVLSGGEVLTHLSGLLKDNTGYDIDRLMCGSEGTLGIITRVRLQLRPKLKRRATAMVGLDSVEAAVSLLAHLRNTVPNLLAVEAILKSAMDVVGECQGLHPPIPARGAWLLIDAASTNDDPTEELASALDSYGADLDVAVGTDHGACERLWRYRESITESINQLGVPHKLDVTLPAGTIGAFSSDVAALVEAEAPGSRLVLFGHLGDGNLHVNILGAEGNETIDGSVLRLVAEHGGSISAEHGIGTAKVPWLHLSRSAAERRAFLAIRKAMDPAQILNPNAIVPFGSSEA